MNTGPEKYRVYRKNDSGLTVQKKGAIPALPTREEIEAALGA